MRVFHGGCTVIDEIDLSKSRNRLDFGKGFYVTNIRSQAEYWATRMGKIHKTKCVVSEFDFDEEAFSDDLYKVLRRATNKRKSSYI